MHSGFISVVGRPNTGKSTLVNYITGQKVSITSPRPQTTRNTVRGILTGEGFQMVFLDTPGVLKPQNRLDSQMLQEAELSRDGVDGLVLVTQPFRQEDLHPTDRDILRKLEGRQNQVVCALNKCDMHDEGTILRSIRILSETFSFREIVPVSALTGKNMDRLQKILRDLIPEGPLYFDSGQYTDQPERQLAAEFIREKILLFLRDEVPHGIGVEIVTFQEREGSNLLDISATIYCEKQTHKGILIGREGEMLKKIGIHARRDIEDLLGIRAHLTLWVKVREDWRNSPHDLRMLGYWRDVK